MVEFVLILLVIGAAAGVFVGWEAEDHATAAAGVGSVLSLGWFVATGPWVDLSYFRTTLCPRGIGAVGPSASDPVSLAAAQQQCIDGLADQLTVLAGSGVAAFGVAVVAYLLVVHARQTSATRRVAAGGPAVGS